MKIFFGLLSALVLTTFSLPAHAIPEAGFQATFESAVVPFFATGEAGELAGVKGAKLRYLSFVTPNERGAIVVVNGRAETFVKYAELAYDLHAQGYSVYLYDHRGQGLSDRLLANPRIGHVERFDDYVTDLETFIHDVVDARPHARRFLVAHSMGGAIGALYLAKHPETFAAASLVTPMLEVNTAPFPSWIARALANVNVAFGLGRRYAPSQGDHDPTNTWDKQQLTHSRARFDKKQEIGKAYPQTGLGGVSNRWVQQSLRATSRLRKLAATIQTPIVLFQADRDALVKASGQNSFCKKAAHCTLVRFSETFHNVIQERDAVRDVFLADTLALFGAAAR
ncbi:MAG: alpha/beta fold hydrolase [Deltaproteobacteria bacterium]|nr:alpha/beta fold hydrolase [Deltaproteobacteria bacterium]